MLSDIPDCRNGSPVMCHYEWLLSGAFFNNLNNFLKIRINLLICDKSVRTVIICSSRAALIVENPAAQMFCISCHFPAGQCFRHSRSSMHIENNRHILVIFVCYKKMFYTINLNIFCFFHYYAGSFSDFSTLL